MGTTSVRSLSHEPESPDWPLVVCPKALYSTEVFRGIRVNGGETEGLRGCGSFKSERGSGSWSCGAVKLAYSPCTARSCRTARRVEDCKKKGTCHSRGSDLDGHKKGTLKDQGARRDFQVSRDHKKDFTY